MIAGEGTIFIVATGVSVRDHFKLLRSEITWVFRNYVFYGFSVFNPVVKVLFYVVPYILMSRIQFYFIIESFQLSCNKYKFYNSFIFMQTVQNNFSNHLDNFQLMYVPHYLLH